MTPPPEILLPPAAGRTLLADLRGETHEGTGLSLPLYVDWRAEESPAVTAPRRRSPAWRAGVRPGDRIVAIDGRDAAAMPSWALADRLLGARGAPVTLEVRRLFGGTERIGLKAARLDGADSRITGAACPHRPAYRVVVPLIGIGAARSVARELANADGRAIVLDLRDCPGGYLSEALAIAGLFVDGLPLGFDRDREVPLHSCGATTWRGGLVVLVNEGTANVAELIAAGLAMHGRALVIGMPTFGRARLHRLVPRGDGWTQLVTVGSPCAIDGSSFAGRGVIPHVSTAGRDALALAAAVAAP